MNNNPHLRYIYIIVLSLIVYESGFACSMYKISIGSKTMVGCNEDAWRLTPRIWFENKTISYKYGAAFTGSRFDGANGYAPQSGMNEMGLCYSRLATHTPKNITRGSANRERITNPTAYLKNILHTCKNVDEVKAYISKYDHSYFNEDVFIYIDYSGKYLVVEPYTMTTGNEATYVLSNFCPSVTTQTDACKLDRYRKGIEFIKTRVDTTFQYCSALSDSMHVCRDKIGDGTLLTSIWDLQRGAVALYFYHDYKHAVHFNIKEELAKGDHIIEIPSLFPSNAEFKQLARYKIPQNSLFMILSLIAAAGLFLFSSIFFLFSYFKNRKTHAYSYIKILLASLAWMMIGYIFILCRNMYIFYFPAPYVDPHNVIVSLSSYIPFILVLLIIPLLILNVKLFKNNTWGSIAVYVLSINNFVYIILLCLFAYWGLFNVFS